MAGEAVVLTNESDPSTQLMCARNTNVQPHPVAACRVGWLTLVPGGRTRGSSPEYYCRVPGFAVLSSHPNGSARTGT